MKKDNKKFKKCSVCKKKKSIDDFHNRYRNLNSIGKREYCTDCNTIKLREYRKNKKDKMSKILTLSLLFSLVSCSWSSIKCFKKCGVFPDGCMSSCQGKIKAKKICPNGFKYYHNYMNYKCKKRATQ